MADPVLLFGPLAPETASAQLWTASGVLENSWVRLDEEIDLPEQGDLLLSLARWRSARARILRSSLRAGIVVEPTERPEAGDDLDLLGVVALNFPKFGDGRAYSTARLLREQLGFNGEIRAIGDVLFDQLPLMRACGFDSFEIVHGPTLRKLAVEGLPSAASTYRRSSRGAMKSRA